MERDKTRLQRFMLDNKQSYYFVGCFVVMFIIFIILLLSSATMNSQFDKEASKIREQANTLRNLLKSEMLQKQVLQNRMVDVLDTIRTANETIAQNIKFIEQSNRQVIELQNSIDKPSVLSPPPPVAVLPPPPPAINPTVAIPVNNVKEQARSTPSPKPKPVDVPVPNQNQQKLTIDDKRNAVKDVRSKRVKASKREITNRKQGFLHAWNSYKTYAWGMDELNPLKKTHKNWLDLGVTIVDALDTLWIMNLRDDFQIARDWIAENLNFNKNRNISFFETTIRMLGGLLSAYEFSRDPVFLEKAEDLAQRLLKAFNDRSPIPFATVNLQSGHASAPSWTGGASILSEMGTIQLEFLYLAYHTKNNTYAEKPMKVFSHLDSLPKAVEGLYPLYINQATGSFKGNDYSIGALGDSFYEYMVKLWLFTDKQSNGYRRMFQESARGMMSTLVQTSSSGFRYMAQTSRGTIQHKMEHLTCFSGGMFALGASEDIDSHKADHFELAADLTKTCHESYDRTATKIGPETFEFRGSEEFVIGSNSAYYILRPEVIESYFVLWRTTHDPKYRDWAWEAFQAIETHCKMEAGYSGLRHVGHIPVVHDDTQQSFFLAETLKYLYLIFSDDDLIPLTEYVFNTEAHPLGIIRDPLDEWDAELRSFLIEE